MTNKSNKKKATRSNNSKPADSPVTSEEVSEDEIEIEETETVPGQAITLEILTTELQNLRTEIAKDVANDVTKQKNEIIEFLQKENAELKNELKIVKEELATKSKKLVDVERDVIDLQQYIRRNNLEICGIPDSIGQAKLEETVIKIAESIDVVIEKKDIEACHRLPNRKNRLGPKTTIVRFINRKHCERLHRKKKDLNTDDVKEKLNDLGVGDNIFINANLCPYNKYLWGKCKRLFDNKLISRFWVYNGYLHIAEKEDDDPIRIDHFTKLEEKFPRFNFDR